MTESVHLSHMARVISYSENFVMSIDKSKIMKSIGFSVNCYGHLCSIYELLLLLGSIGENKWFYIVFCLLVVFFCELKQNTLIWRTRKLKTFVFSLYCSLNCIMCVQCVLQRSPYISLIIPFRTAESGKNIIRKKAINFIGFSGFLFSSVHREYKHTTRYTIFPIFH